MLTDATRLFVQQHRIGRVVKDRTLLCDLLNPAEMVQRLVVPSSFTTEPYISTGLGSLRGARPKIVVILTMHRHKADFSDLVNVAGDYLAASPVSGVEASAKRSPRLNKLPRPSVNKKNRWLKKFQQAQFPWHDKQGKVMLPSEPFFCGKLGERYEEISRLFDGLKAKPQGYDPISRQQIMRLLYASMSAAPWAL